MTIASADPSVATDVVHSPQTGVRNAGQDIHTIGEKAMRKLLGLLTTGMTAAIMAAPGLAQTLPAPSIHTE